MGETFGEQLTPTEPTDVARRTRAPGDRSRARVLEQAAALATLEGLEGISIARLATATGMPKSSVYVLFGSKQQLQLATIDAARASFITHVVTPAITTSPPGRQQLLQLCEGFMDYVEQRIFPGGCFFVTASAEMGGRHGPVRDRVALYQRQWRELLMQTAHDAHAAGELPQAATLPSSRSSSARSSPGQTSPPSCTTTTRSSTAPAMRSDRVSAPDRSCGTLKAADSGYTTQAGVSPAGSNRPAPRLMRVRQESLYRPSAG